MQLPFGISSAPEAFPKKNREIFGAIDGAQIYFDGLVISGVNEVGHNRSLKFLLERPFKYKIKFNPNKI